MSPIKTKSAAFISWVAQHLNGSELDETAYDLAVLEAEHLEHRKEVTHEEWVEMVRKANEALTRCS